MENTGNEGEGLAFSFYLLERAMSTDEYFFFSSDLREEFTENKIHLFDDLPFDVSAAFRDEDVDLLLESKM